MPASDEKTWAIMSHVGQLLLGFIAPLVIMLAKGEESPFVKHQAKEGLNFVITVYIALVGAHVYTAFFLGSIVESSWVLWLSVITALITLLCVMPVRAALATNKNGWYRYPLILRLVK